MRDEHVGRGGAELSVDNDTDTAGAQVGRIAAHEGSGEGVTDNAVIGRARDTGLTTTKLSVANTAGTGSSGRGFPTRCQLSTSPSDDPLSGGHRRRLSCRPFHKVAIEVEG